MADDYGEKTEEPTERRRREAREKGNVARSTDLNAALVMLAATSTLAMLGKSLSVDLARMMHMHLSGPAWISVDRNAILHHFWDVAGMLAGSLLAIMLTMMLTGVVASVVQIGPMLAGNSLQPQLSRLSPLGGLKRIFSIAGLMKLAVSLGKLAVLVIIAALAISAELPHFVMMTEMTPSLVAVRIGQAIVSIGFQMAAALIVLAALDFGFQKWKHEQDLKMTKEELRQEMKDMDGDPHIRHRRREAHRKMVEANDLRQVADADVVITNPTHIAIAIKYDAETMSAPRVVAKGMGEIAARIRKIAAEHGIPIIERKPLARALYKNVKVGQSIPLEMYEVFVEIMAYVYRLTGRATPKLPRQ